MKLLYTVCLLLSQFNSVILQHFHLTHAHACTHTCTNSHTHAHTHAHAHMHTLTHTCTHSHTHTHTHTRTHRYPGKMWMTLTAAQWSWRIECTAWAIPQGYYCTGKTLVGGSRWNIHTVCGNTPVLTKLPDIVSSICSCTDKTEFTYIHVHLYNQLWLPVIPHTAATAAGTAHRFWMSMLILGSHGCP